jgi:hypothetical protein
MVATYFSADTPLVVTAWSRYGIAGNWLWWNMAASGMLTVFVYARLWRRAGVMTDVELELRYSGKPAAFLRFRALYLGIPINCIVMGWVNLAMLKILQVTLGLDAGSARGCWWRCWRSRRSPPSRGWGRAGDRPGAVRVEDGRARSPTSPSARPAGSPRCKTRCGPSMPPPATSRLAFFPSTDSAWMPAIAFRLPRRERWASWYCRRRARRRQARGAAHLLGKASPGLFATLWFNIAHYAVGRGRGF